jgi:hypothetical protein
MHYRVYFLEQGKNTSIPFDLDCDTVEDAYALAQRDANGRKIEIWQAERRMGVFGANVDF